MKIFDNDKVFRNDIEMINVLRSSDGDILSTLDSNYLSIIYNIDDISVEEVQELIDSNKYMIDSRLVVIPTQMADRLQKVLDAKIVDTFVDKDDLLGKLKPFCDIYSSLDGVYDKVLSLINGYPNINEKQFQAIQKELLMKMSFSDTTLKGVKDSQEYKDNSFYNKGIRDSISIVKKYLNERPIGKWQFNINPYGELKEFICDCGRSSQEASKFCPQCGIKMDNSDIE